jgi:4-amino-4-deoxy-L-arabinose transferase-like glycosyltransferase
LLGLLLVLLGLFVGTQADSYGRTYDEELQDVYGSAVLAWYSSGGQDTTFLQFSGILYMPQHGPFFETVVAIAESATGERWTTRAVVTGVAALLGVVAIALCGFELGGWWMAFLAAVGLVLYPRYSGAMFNNSKDVPFAAAMILVLWLALRLVRRYRQGRAYLLDASLVGLAIGVAASIRVVAVIWYALFALLFIGWWFRHAAVARAQGTWRTLLARQAIAAGLVAGVSFATMCLLWPYVFLDPVPHLIDSIQAMSNYPWTGMVPLGDDRYSALDLPARYTIEWLVIGSPLAVVVLALVGGVIALAQLVRTRTVDARLGLVVLAFGVPVGALVILNSTMYNGLRQFLFVAPAMILLAVFGLTRLLTFLARRGWRPVAGLVAAVVLLAQAHVVKTAIDIHPYEYAYFSPVVGGFGGAAGRYELEYWGACNKAAAEWLAAHHADLLPRPPRPKVTVYSDGPPFLAMTYLPSDVFVFDATNPDFYLWSMHEWIPDAYPAYRSVHEITVDGQAICVVKARTGSVGARLGRTLAT